MENIEAGNSKFRNGNSKFEFPGARAQNDTIEFLNFQAAEIQKFKAGSFTVRLTGRMATWGM